MTDQAVVAAHLEYINWIRTLAASRRFGDRDRLGSANLIDSAARLRALESVRSGVSVSLARPLAPDPSGRGDDRPGFSIEAYSHTMPDATTSGASVVIGSDHLELDCHGTLNTHLDGLSHVGLDGTWYGGWSFDDSAGPSIVDLAEAGLVTRAVHVDIPAVRGTEWVGIDEPVCGADIDAALAASGVTFDSGDALLLDMGRDRYEAAGHSWSFERNPGVGADGAAWISDHDVSVLCWDFLDAYHPHHQMVPVPWVSVHLLLWAIGLLLVDNCDFSRLRSALPAGQATGALVVAPLPILGATGNNVNPILLL
jgi:kynurenine formamidase